MFSPVSLCLAFGSLSERERGIVWEDKEAKTLEEKRRSVIRRPCNIEETIFGKRHMISVLKCESHEQCKVGVFWCEYHLSINNICVYFVYIYALCVTIFVVRGMSWHTVWRTCFSKVPTQNATFADMNATIAMLCHVWQARDAIWMAIDNISACVCDNIVSHMHMHQYTFIHIHIYYSL